MNANEIMTNEEAMEVAAEIVSNGGSKTRVLKALAALGFTGAVALIIYKLVKAISARRKAKKEQFEAEAGSYREIDEDDIDDDYVEDEE